MASMATAGMLSSWRKMLSLLPISCHVQHVSYVNVIVVRKEGATGSHHDFHVRKSVVLNVLQWLIGNNLYYRNVTIDDAVLDLLPNDDDLSGLTTMQVNTEEEELPAREDVDPHNAHVGSPLVPMPVRCKAEQQIIRQSIQQLPSAPPTIPWPSANATPID